MVGKGGSGEIEGVSENGLGFGDVDVGGGVNADRRVRK